jgi:hypothetical protein
LFAPVGMNVEAVVVDPRGSWSLTLLDRAHGTPTQVVVGRSEARARIGRFVRLLPQLMTNPERRIERADLRYTNGFALVWAKNATDVRAPNAIAPATPRVALRAAGRGAAHIASAPSNSPTVAADARAVASPFPIPGLS